MFNGVPDQFHQFITPRTSSLPLHLPFPLHANNTTPNNTFPAPFDPYNHHHNPSHHHHHHHHHQFPSLHQVQPNLLHPAAPLHPHQSPSSSSTVHKHEEKEENSTTVPMNFEIERDQRQQLPELIDPWTNDEVLSLLRIRSSMESWFPELTWEHVSRKLAELGYKRSAEKCKEKFEEESRYFNNINNYGKSSYRFLSELEELYQGGGDQNPHNHHNQEVESEKNHHQQVVENPSEGQEEDKMMGNALEDQDGSVTKQKEHHEEVVAMEERTNNKERKRKRGGSGGGRFEMFKGFCESIVHKMMEQQEQMHNKLIEDMVRRDEEKFAREEAWKKQEMERMNKELEIMAQEQAIAGDRQANIIEFLKKFSPEIQSLGIGNNDNNGRDKLVKVTTNVNGSNPNSTTAATVTTSSPLHSQNPRPSTIDSSLLQPTPSSAVILNPSLVAAENPSSSSNHPAQDTLQVVASSTTASAPPPAPAGKNPSSSLNNDPIETNSVPNKATSNRVSTSTSTTEKDDIGRRWPKDEVLALINLRCTSQNNNNNNNSEDNNNNNKEGNNKAPLWERISQGMLELGYNRTAKRCKEKWENINKYFRKTKDVNKKRSLDSRTCPYFHQLSNLYSQGFLVLQPEKQENQLNPPANNHGNVVTDQNETQLAETSQVVGSGGFSVQVDHGGEKTLMQVPSLDFDQF